MRALNTRLGWNDQTANFAPAFSIQAKLSSVVGDKLHGVLDAQKVISNYGATSDAIGTGSSRSGTGTNGGAMNISRLCVLVAACRQDHPNGDKVSNETGNQRRLRAKIDFHVQLRSVKFALKSGRG